MLKGSGTGVLGAAVSCFNDSLHGTCRARGPHRAARRCSDHPSYRADLRRQPRTKVPSYGRLCDLPTQPRATAPATMRHRWARQPVLSGSSGRLGGQALPRPPSVRGRTTPRGSACTSCLIRTSTGRCAWIFVRFAPRARAVAIARDGGRRRRAGRGGRRTGHRRLGPRYRRTMGRGWAGCCWRLTRKIVWVTSCRIVDFSSSNIRYASILNSFSGSRCE